MPTHKEKPKKELSGVFPVVPTPFNSDGSIDEAGFRRIVSFLLEAGADGLVFPGLASEYDHLTLEERLKFVAIIGEMAALRCPWIVGASGKSIEESTAMARAGAAAGAAAAMVMTPVWLDGQLDAIADFYSGLAAEAGLPLMLQNAPKPMGLGLDADQVAKIVERSGAVAYVKEETMPCGQRITALRALSGDRLDGVFGGAGGRYIVDELSRGANGTMPAAELVEGHVQLMAAHRAGDVDRMRSLQERMLPILTMQAVFRWSLTKEVLRLRGLISSTFVRAPGPRLDEIDQRETLALLERVHEFTGPLPTKTVAA